MRLSGEWAKWTGQLTIELVLSKVPSSSSTSVGAEVLGTADMAHSIYPSVVDEQTGQLTMPSLSSYERKS